MEIVFQDSIEVERLDPLPNLPEMDMTESLDRTLAWVNTNPRETENVPPFRVLLTPAKQFASWEGYPHLENRAPGRESTPNQRSGWRNPVKNQGSEVNHNAANGPSVSLQTFYYLGPYKLTGKQPPLCSTSREPLLRPALESFTSTTQQLVATLAKQSSPKCHPDVFDGDVAMFHLWQRSFKAKVRDTDPEADQEINYLRSHTKGSRQLLVDNYKKRQGETFGNSAALTQALLERLSQTTNFADKHNARMKKLADFCAEVDCQMIQLPGLACHNYPVALRPIVEKVPLPLISKGEKQIMQYAEEHDDAYPPFSEAQG